VLPLAFYEFAGRKIDSIKRLIIYNLKYLNKQELILSLSRETMVDLRKNVANQFAKQTLSKAKDALGIEDNQTTASNGSGQGPNGQEGPINWQNYNYPPLIRLVHYSTDYLRQPHLGLAKKIHACAILVFVN
jgi:hypothetical protein